VLIGPETWGLRAQAISVVFTGIDIQAVSGHLDTEGYRPGVGTDVRPGTN
jgi:hypothetical protein